MIIPTPGFYLNQYYVDTNGKAISGWKQIDGKWYYFDPEKKTMYKNTIRIINGKRYCFDYDGTMVTGWIASSLNGYALPSGELIEKGWKQIDGKWYYFIDGTKQIGLINDNGVHYFISSDGGDYKNITGINQGWILSGSDWGYMEAGKLVRSDLRVINGKLYGFDSYGFMLKNQEYNNYYFNNSGNILINSWREVGPNRKVYYDENGQKVTNSWKVIDGNKYYFNGSGEYKATNSIIDNKLCEFDKNGVLQGTPKEIKNGWNLVDGFWYFVENGNLKTNQLITINNILYHLDYYGRMSFDEVVYIHDSMKQSNDMYYATLNGAIYKNGWCGINNTYYADGTGKLLTGLQMINGVQYLFDANGTVVKDSSRLLEDLKTIYITDSTGKVFEILKANEINGWKLATNGKWYFSGDGKFKNQFFENNGNIYYCDYFTGALAVNQATGYGYANASGSINKNCWTGKTYYVNGVMQLGMQKIDGKDYLFNGGYGGIGVSGYAVGGILQSIAGIGTTITGTNVYFDGKGNASVVNNTNGWKQIDGKWYYLGSVPELLTKINGVYYSIGIYKEMNTNRLISVYTGENENALYYVNNQGNLTKGWVILNGSKYYFDDNYKALKGERVIDGVRYIFNKDGVLIS